MSIDMKYLQSVAGVLTRSFLDLGARLIVHVVGLALFFDENSVKILEIPTVNYYLPTGHVCSVDARFFGAVQYHLSDRADDC